MDENHNYLIIIRKDEESQRWVVDHDSEHILEDEGGNYPIQELRVATIRAIEPDQNFFEWTCEWCGRKYPSTIPHCPICNN